MALSPAHYVIAEAEKIEATRAMRIGTTVHHLVLGPHRTRPLRRFDGDARRGKDWDRFVEQNTGAEIVTAPEWADAEPVANAVLADPVAAKLLAGARREVAVEWYDAGIACATDGIDFVGDGYFGDLKTTTCTEPVNFARHAFKLHYHAQLAWLQTGAIVRRLVTAEHPVYLLGVEVSPPYAVTVLRMTPEALDLGRKSYALWLERLRSCRESNHWPAYTQAIVDFELPAWVGGDDE